MTVMVLVWRSATEARYAPGNFGNLYTCSRYGRSGCHAQSIVWGSSAKPERRGCPGENASTQFGDEVASKVNGLSFHIARVPLQPGVSAAPDAANIGQIDLQSPGIERINLRWTPAPQNASHGLL